MMRSSFVLLAIVVAAVACERAQDRGAETFLEKIIADSGRDGEVEVDRRNGAIRVTMGTAATPKGWPEDVPVYPNARRVKIRGEPKTRHSLLVTSADPLSSVSRFYRERLRELGWTIERAGRGKKLRARKGKRFLDATFSSGALFDGSRVDIVITRGA